MFETKSFRDRVRERFKELQLTQGKVASKIDVTYGQLNNWILRGSVPKRHRQVFAQILGITVDDLVSWSRGELSAHDLFLYNQIRLSETDLQKLIGVQKVLGDLSITMVVKIVEELRAGK